MVRGPGRTCIRQRRPIPQSPTGRMSPSSQKPASTSSFRAPCTRRTPCLRTNAGQSRTPSFSLFQSYRCVTTAQLRVTPQAHSQISCSTSSRQRSVNLWRRVPERASCLNTDRACRGTSRSLRCTTLMVTAWTRLALVVSIPTTRKLTQTQMVWVTRWRSTCKPLDIRSRRWQPTPMAMVSMTESNGRSVRTRR